MPDNNTTQTGQETGFGSRYKGSEIDSAIGAVREGSLFDITLSKNSWANGSQTITDARFKSAGKYGYIVGPGASTRTEYLDCVVQADDVTVDGQITFHCEEAPGTDLTASIGILVDPLSADGTSGARVFNVGGGGKGGSSFELVSLTLKTPPTKTTYKSGEPFDPAGMEVTAAYSNGLTFTVTGYKVEPSTLTDGVTKVVISYSEGRTTKSVNVPVTVTPVLASIAVTTPPTKTQYNYQENFDPAGMAVTATYSDGSTQPATGYTAEAVKFNSLGAQNVTVSYTDDGITKTTTCPVTVKAIQLNKPTQSAVPEYTGSSIIPQWSGYDASKMTMAGTLTGTNAGEYTAQVDTVYGYCWPDETTTSELKWHIDRATIPVPTQSGALIYDGTNKTPTFNDYDSSKMTMAGELTKVDAGTYNAEFTPKANYRWPDGTFGTKQVSWVITSVVVPIPSQSGTLTYNGSPQSPTWANLDTAHSTIQTLSKTDAGDYVATATLTAGVWSDGSTADKSIPWSIGRKKLTAIPAQTGSLPYTGSERTPSFSNYNTSELNISGDTKKTNAGDYSATFTPTPNYAWPDGSTGAKQVPWSITRATVNVPTQSGTLTYNGASQSPSWNGYETAKMTLGGTTSATNAGTNQAEFTPTGNYQWPDGSTGKKTVPWTINPAANSVTCNPPSLSLTADNPTQSFTVSRLGTGGISAASSDTSKATVSVNGNTVSVTGKDSGNVKITVSVAASTNYLAGTAEVSVSIEMYPDNFNECTPAQISALSQNGQIGALFAVGDETAEINMNGKVSDGLTLTNFKVRAFIVGIDHNQAVESPGAHRVHLQLGKVGGKLIGFCDSGYNSSKTSGQWLNMNNANSNAGGWNGSLMRSNIMGGGTTPGSPKANSLLAALPADWRAVMKSVTKYTDNTGGGSDTASYVTATTEYFCPLAEFEYFGARYNANSAEKNKQLQYDYYKSGNSRIHYRHDNTGMAVYTWTRSVLSNGSHSFVRVITNGNYYYISAYYSSAVSPLLFI